MWFVVRGGCGSGAGGGVVVVVVVLLLIKEYKALTQLSVALQIALKGEISREVTLRCFGVPAHCPRKRKRFIDLRISASEQTWPCPGLRCCRSA